MEPEFYSVRRMDVGKWSIFRMADKAILQSAQTVCLFGPNGNESFIATNTDDVFALGVNMISCVALPCGQGALKVTKVDKLSKMNIVTFSFGSAPHVLALTGMFTERKEYVCVTVLCRCSTCNSRS